MYLESLKYIRVYEKSWYNTQGQKMKEQKKFK